MMTMALVITGKPVNLDLSKGMQVPLLQITIYKEEIFCRIAERETV